MQTRSFLPAAVLLAIPSFVSAQEQLAQLDPILVTPTRTAQTTDQTLASVTVIDREEIERLQPKEFVELLRGRAGIGLTQNGPFGKTTSLYMRGTASDHVLLLVDGVRMGSATLGSPSWQFLPPSEIERVEIVRGPRTSLYGSDAIGGVIQVFTKEGDGAARARAHMGAGSLGTREYGAGVSGSTETTRYHLSGSHFETDGIDVQEGLRDNDRDGYSNSSFAGRLSHELPGGVEVFGNFLHSSGETEFDRGGPRRDWIDFVHHASRIGIRGQVNALWFSELTIAHSRDENETFEDAEFSSQIDTSRDLLAWQNDILVADRHLLTLGADYQEDRVSGSNDYAETRRDNWGVYGQLQLDLGRHSVSGSLRQDDNEAFGKETTGQVAWGFQLADAWRTRASYGTAFNAPTFNDLYWPTGGNPDLDPERSETMELGLRYSQGTTFADVAVFQSELDDLIDWAPLPGSSMFAPQNVSEVRIRGVEIEAGKRFGEWSTTVAFTHLDPEDRQTGKVLRRRPDNAVRVDVDRGWSRFSVGGTVTAEGRRYNDASNEDRLGGFALVDLRASYRISSEWTLNARLDNVLDKEYVSARSSVYDATQNAFYDVDYNQPGRAFFVSLNYQQQ